MTTTKTQIPLVLQKFESEILSDWSKQQSGGGRQQNMLKEGELKHQMADFIRDLVTGTKGDNPTDINSPSYEPMRELLTSVSKSRAIQGFTPAQTASFVLSFKKPLFTRLKKDLPSAETLADEIWVGSELLDNLALLTTELYQKGREEIINRQQQELLELSTPVVKLWNGILALPLIGTLDSARTQVVMESLLQQIVSNGADVAIIDITGVPTVDTLVAQHLMKTVTAARLMGAECIISGIRPQIAQTIVHLGVDLGNIVTKSSLADAFAFALDRRKLTVTRQTPKSTDK